MIIIALIIFKLTEREDMVAAGWWMKNCCKANNSVHTAWSSWLCCISMETNGLLGWGPPIGHQGWKRFWSQSGWEPGKERGFVACGEYVMVPPGLVTTMCVFPFISSETCHIMGLNTGYINSGIETKQTAQTTAEVIQ